MSRATHKCIKCQALWKKNSDGSWSLAKGSPRPLACCNNAPMGDQIQPLSIEPNVTEQSTMRDLIMEAHACALEKGWWESPGGEPVLTPRDLAEGAFPEKLCLIHSEVSEALEAYRTPPVLVLFSGPGEDQWAFTDAKGKPEGILAELADVVIRIFDLVGALGMGDRFFEVLVAKMRYNRTRPHRHGGKRC